ncbi:MAG TPA: AAA family ATPase [Chitinophagaceae bacterium]|nr:AAA family ATPase [Chitinophagaceae bacterium]
MSKTIKIVVTGPESTGKSTLCELLARHYNTLWCPEYAREYLLKYGLTYNYDDLLEIARGQIALEDVYAERTDNETGNVYTALENQVSIKKPSPTDSPALLFIDTDMYVMKVWCEYVYHKCHPYILEQIASRKYDLYLLCNPDLPWEPDAMREYPDEQSRLELYEIYRNLMLNQATPFIEISGSYNERLQTAIDAVDKLIS